ncbi:sulfurtransferase-like selenium metabolism protein YedF [Zhaonella formicivorans]|jgi:selenium metabolism protein YedF|uniref:sulfurtransferase-like selenium metabolism protein YedF n=1 Tax=Zhaonella formicivorans TaxID=2528593 RepID=UPI0010E77F33|nr:sulfurtransferase-like selenium metabolism protein YedF [Zhaonella formicivorans]
MENYLDVRGLACPEPVISTKKALEQMDAGNLVTIVDNEAAKENVVRFAKSMNYQVEVEEKGGEYYIHITKEKLAGVETTLDTGSGALYLVTGDKLGRGDEELGAVLMRSLFYSLAESEIRPDTLILMNAGVKLACEGSPVLSDLIALEKKGTEVLACGTCLDFYRLKEKLCVGKVTNMYAIVEHLNLAAKVISL